MRYASVLIAVLLTGCGPGSNTDPFSTALSPAPPPGQAQAGENGSRGAASTGKVVALLGGRPIRWSVLREAMIEVAGGQVLGEWVLSNEIESALEREGLSVTAEDVAREKALMLQQFSDDPNQAARLLAQLREQRGYGPTRFPMLLRRNAALRKLVADEVEVTEPMVRRAYEQQYGEKTAARLILVPTLHDASAVLERLKGGESFVDLAVEVSRDTSRDQGGLLPSIAPGDATFPQAIRDVVAQLEPGEVSDPVALDSGFAILRAERKIEPQGVEFDQVAGELRQQVRGQVERTLMRRRARVLMQDVDVTVLDAHLDKAWKQQRDALLEIQ